MNGVHLHLLLNHLPVIGSLFAILMLVWALIRKNTEIARAALGLFVIAAITGLAAYFTGEPAEDAAESIAGVSRQAIHSHEESAELATVLLSGYGIFALGALFYLRKRAAAFPRKLLSLALVLALVPAGAMAWTANQGGKIRHPEITSAGAPMAANGAGTDVARHDDGEGAPERGSARQR
ncbi:MAG TPA: hypothetical protein VFT57_14730 [Gemmatimonadaceae bacterium]|jgi:hypothetical protein|nr:hypothetical protein [Gemmatimonadaceae bacterium]